MSQTACDNLDDFLAGELAADRRRAFDAHLADCPACRAEVADWHSLCRTLKAATDQLEVPSAGLSRRIERGVKVTAPTATKEGRSWRIAALIAVSLWAAVLFSEFLRPTLPPDAKPTRPKAFVAATVPTAVPARPSIEVHGKVIGVPIDIGDPKVTVVWLYPEAGGTDTEK